MDYLQFSHAVLTVIAPFSPLFYGLGLLTLLAAAFFIYQRRCRKLNKHLELPASQIEVTETPEPRDVIEVVETPELGDIFDDAGYFNARFTLQMLADKNGVRVQKRNRKGKWQQLDVESLSSKELKAIYDDDARLNAALSGDLVVVSDGKNVRYYHEARTCCTQL